MAADHRPTLTGPTRSTHGAALTVAEGAGH